MTSLTSFGLAGVPSSLVRRLGALGLTVPTLIQSTALPSIMGGRDVVITAETGSGKTMLFALPALARLASPRPSSLILSPTKELCKQIYGVIRSVDSDAPVSLLGGDRAPRASPAILIGTPSAVQTVSTVEPLHVCVPVLHAVGLALRVSSVCALAACWIAALAGQQRATIECRSSRSG